MAQYKEKYKQVVINSIKHPSYYLFGDVVVLNLNACFVKRNNFIKFLLIVKEALELSNKVNLCNLASLCYKLNISYESFENQVLRATKLLLILKSRKK